MKRSVNVLFLGPPDMLGWVKHQYPPGFEIRLALDEAAVDAALPDSDVVLDAYMKVRFPRERILRGAKLRLVVTATTGADHIDSGALAERGIPLLTLRGQTEVLRGITAAAEHSWLLLLACARQLRSAAAHVLDGGWDRNQFPGLMLRGRTIGIIGCGRIGTWMARYAAAFEMRRLGYDPHVDPWPNLMEKTDLKTLLTTADFVSVHVPLTEETRHLLGTDELAIVRPGAIVVNTSRGEVIDPGALLHALTEGRIAAAGLDVLASEPDTGSDPLLAYARTHQNLLITPHIGGFSPDALKHVLAFSCRRVVEHFSRSNA